MKKTTDAWLCKLAVVPLILVLFTGCATTRFISPEVAARVQKVAVYEEISAPTFLSTPERGGNSALTVAIGDVIEAKAQSKFTLAVRAKLDFQEFARQTTRELFLSAIRQHAGWTLVPTNEVESADAMFVVDVVGMGIVEPPPLSFTPGYRPVVSIRATLIANPPFEIDRRKAGLQTTDPAAHPILFEQTGSVTRMDGQKAYSIRSLTGNPETFKSVFRETFETAVKRLADGWTQKMPAK